jgi:hypothetical protein
MVGVRRTADSARGQVTNALADGRRRTGGPRPSAVDAPHAVLAMQRSAGNAAVSALMAARLRSPGEAAVGDIDAALRELRQDEPAMNTVEVGLRRAQAAGVPVDLEGPKPPPSALAVIRTGFGPGSVPTKKPVPPKKPVPDVSPLGKAGAATTSTGGSVKLEVGIQRPETAAAGGSSPVTAARPGELMSDKLLEPPQPPPGLRPAQDPAFAQVTGQVEAFAKSKKAHPPAAKKAQEAQNAAVAPTDDVAAQAKEAKADMMDAQQAGSFDTKAFIAAVKAAIEAKSPKTLEEADEYKESGKAGEVKGEVKGLVTSGKNGQVADIEAATEAPPDQSKAVVKPVTPMAQEDPGQVVAIPAGGAVPKPAPPEQVNLAAGKHEANQEMGAAEVSEVQLANSNEPAFEQALADKRAASAHADTAPGEFRQQEKEVIDQRRTEAAAETAAGVEGIQSTKGAALAKMVADQGKAKTKDEAKRAEVTTKVQSIFAATEADVTKILDGLDPKVEAAFDQGEAGARAAFESYVATKMSAYKKDRYSGWLGGMRWAKDKIVGMPDKVNEFYEAGREIYLKRMDVVITKVADIVGTDLKAAKQRIATGKAEIASYVKSLPTNLQKVGSEAAEEINDKFEQLESDVNDKQDSVVDTLASKYTEARSGLDERIEALQAENKGLVDKAIGAIKAVINTIRELVAMLTQVLARAADVVGDIVKDPINFLGNLIAGVKGGILKFKENIVDHLRKGLMEWLFGALAEGGVELPETFDVKGIIRLLASIFGVTWTNIRNRLVKQIGFRAMSAVEGGVGIFQTLASEGVGGLWEMFVEKLGDVKEMIFEQVREFVESKIITAGITWLISLLNPAAAFIKACKLIYDVVMFFVNNAARIMKFVDTVIDSVADIVRGNVSGVVEKINNVLGQMVPILIGFLASVIGLGGIGQKIRKIVETLQKPFNRALDFVIKTGLKLAGPLIRRVSGVRDKVKAKAAAGKAWVKGKAEAGKAALIRLFKRTFTVSGVTHTLKAVKRTANAPLRLTVASDEKPVAIHQRDAAALAERSGKPALAQEAIDVIARAAAIEETTNASDKEEAKIRAAIAELALIVQAVWARIGYRGVPPTESFADSSTAGVVGEIGRHADQGTRGYRGVDTRAERDRLESEHVVPRAWLLALVDGFLGAVKRKSSADRSLYRSMTTIMIYKGAADYKTEKGKTTDNVVISKLKALTSSEVGVNPGKNPLAVANAVRKNFDGPIASRIKLTKQARNHEHQASQRQGSPKPSDSDIEGAAMRQLLDVIEFLVRSIQKI